MQFIKTIFWNDEQQRLRAFWRLTAQLIALAGIALLLQTGLGLVAFGVLMAQENIALEQLSNPQVTQEILGAQAVQQFVLESPFMMTLYTLAMLLACVLSIWPAAHFLDRRPFADFGFHLDKDWWMDFGFGLSLGAFLMLIIFLVEFAFGWVTVSGTFVTRNPGAPFPLAILPPLFTFLAVGFYEELFSRGYQLQNLAEGLNWPAIGPGAAIVIAAVLSSAVFGVLHVANPNSSAISTFNIFVAGALPLGVGYLLTGEMAIPIGVHITWNFFQGNVFGFPVSGVDFSSATFVAVEQAGPRLWTGSVFGPEAGLVGLGAMLLGGLLTILWVRWRYGRIRLHLALAEPPDQSQR
jgi:membrane protease YdiL (CAAX protease family)